VFGASYGTAAAYIGDISHDENRAKNFGFIGAAWGSGFTLGPVIGGFVAEHLGARAPFFVAAGLALANVAFGYFVLPESLAPEKRMTFSWRRANPIGAMILLRSHPELTGLAVVTFLLHFAHHVFSAVWVLYAMYRYGWTPWQTGVALAAVGVLDMIVQGLLVGPVSKRLGDRGTMIVGLFGGAVGIACMGLATSGMGFALALLPNAIWGLAMPTLQSLMTRHVSESEQGQLQGATMSVASIAGIVSPIFFGAVYAWTVQPGRPLSAAALSFYIAAAVLLLGAIIGWSVAHKAGRAELKPAGGEPHG
jgi:DHA1 family tetracycline resistance protein-like MFS transporter